MAVLGQVDSARKSQRAEECSPFPCYSDFKVRESSHMTVIPRLAFPAPQALDLLCLPFPLRSAYTLLMVFSHHASNSKAFSCSPFEPSRSHPLCSKQLAAPCLLSIHARGHYSYQGNSPVCLDTNSIHYFRPTLSFFLYSVWLLIAPLSYRIPPGTSMMSS